jgi:membrane fusion protein (multidrug efflux system)
MEVAERAVSDQLQFPGQLQAVNSVDLVARVEGELIQRNFEEGAKVSQGQLLLLIDPAPFEAEVKRLQAELAKTRATLVKEQQELTRAKKLFEEEIASQQILDQAIAREKEGRASQASAQAALEKAKLDLSYTRIESPVDGTIGKVNVDVGNVVNRQTGPLVTITQLDPIYASFAVSERALLERTSQNAEREQRGEAPRPLIPRLRLSDGSLYDAPGTLDYIDPDINVTTGTLTVRGTFPNPNQALRPGMYVTIMLSSDATARRVVIPQAAVAESQLGTTVFVVDDENRVGVRKVELGARMGDEWVVEKGLEIGERIIVKGMQKARPGAEVTPVLAGAESDEPSEEATQAEGETG